MHKNDELTKTPRPSCSMAVAKHIKWRENISHYCLDSLSAASAGKRLPKGINITGTDGKPASGIEGMPWGYMFLHNKTAPIFEREMRMYNDMHPDSAHACFIHRSFTYR